MSESALQLAYDRIEELELKLESANERIHRTESFINRFLDPEDLGYVVNNYVRDDAREALGRERVESGDGKEKL